MTALTSDRNTPTAIGDARQGAMADPQAVIHAFAQGAVDLPVDYEHQSDKPGAAQSGPVPAAGWIKELKADATGLWGRVEWTAQAREMIGAKAYRYLSPSFMYAKAGGVITRLKGAGLVHNPNLQLQALASALGLPEDADESAVLCAVQELSGSTATPDPAKFVPIEAVADLMKDPNKGRASQNEERALAKVTDTLARGYISPAMKGWATALCTQDEASFDAFIAKSVPQFAHLLQPSHMDGAPPGSAQHAATQSPVAASVCSQLGLKPGTLEE